MKKASFSAVLSTFILCMLFWILITGSFAVQELIAGAVVSIFVALFSARFLIRESSFWLWNPKHLFPLIAYCLVIFPIELVKANVKMVGYVFGSKDKLRPGIVKVPTELQSQHGQVMLANSITLTPGTITLETGTDGRDGREYFFIHWIDVTETDREKAGDAIKGTMEKWVRRIWK